MKILYGINGEGLGHLNRSKIIIRELFKLGHEIKVASYGAGKDYCDFKINGITFDISKSINKVKALKDFLKLNRNQEIPYKPDLVITDFEPTTAYFARKHKIPLVSIDNQHRFCTIDNSLPLNLRFSNIILGKFTKFFIGKTDENIVSCFYKIGNSCNPILPTLTKGENCNFNLVYLKGNFIKDYLKNNSKSKTNSIIFTNDVYPDHCNNCIFHPIDAIYFKNMLRICTKVISHAGHQVISESLYLNKKIDTIPLNQPEQQINHFKLNQLKKQKKIIVKNGTREVMDKLEKWLK